MAKAFEIDTALWAIDEQWLLRLRAMLPEEMEDPEALSARLGVPLRGGSQAVTRGDVAVVPIVGPIFRYETMLTRALNQLVGVTTLASFTRDFMAADADPSVESIVLDVDSPGGDVSGINEAAGMIAAASKPVVAYISGVGASAAYWLASAANEVVVDATSRVGSIGVVMAVSRDRNSGGAVEIVSSQSPNKRTDPATAEGRAKIQAQVDAIADVFVDSVARNRSVSRETVLSDFGQGGVKVGQAAIAAGMADSAGSLESTLAQLSSGEWPKKRRQMMAAKDDLKNEAAVTETDLAKLVENAKLVGFSDGEKKGLDDGWKAGIDEGTKKERERLLAIDKLAMPGHEKLVAEAKESGMSPADFAMKQTETEKATRESRLAAIKKDGKQSADVVASETGETIVADVANDTTKPLEERAKAAWDGDDKVRAEFGDFDRYLAFRKNEPRIRILRKAAS